jgi:M6 family metalloprotease-like protein
MVIIQITFEGSTNQTSYGDPFAQQSFKSGTSCWANKIFGTGSGQLNEYWQEVSYGKFLVYPAEETHGTANDGIITVSLSGNHPNFVVVGEEGGKDPTPWFTDAVSKADPYIDFSAYDADADGHLSSIELQVMFLVAGGESAAGYIPGIWGHMSCLNPSPNLDGYQIGECGYQGYSTFGERQGNYDATIGVMAHELGHVIFCYPDLYDTTAKSSGIGVFGLMSHGVWGSKQGEYGGATPAHLMAWSKYKSDGSLCYKWYGNTANFNNVVFELPDNISSNTSSVTLYHTTHTNFNTKIINISGKTKEYFMLENIGHGGYQAGLDYIIGGNDNTSGIAIWHIDDNQSGNNDYNHKLVDLEEAADAGLDLGTHSGKQTNLFFSGNKTEFSDSTDPNSKTYSGTSSGITIDNISAAGDSMTFDVTF